MTDINKEEIRERLGNIEQIRDLLFGSQVRDFETRFDSLETSLSTLQQEMRDRLHKLNDDMTSELRAAVDSLEKKIKYLSLTTHEEVTDVRQTLDRTDKRIATRIELVEQSFNDKANALKNEVAQSKHSLNQDIQTLKEQVLTDLESRFVGLKEGKVSRDDMAEIFFELCMKLKGSDFIPDLKEAADRQIKTDFLLPEQRENMDRS